MYSKRISFIVPVYNAAQYIRRCVETIYMQDLSLDDFEIILIDDGSLDDSKNIIDEIARENNNVTAVSQENGGAAASRNKGLDLASGAYVCFVDADDFLIPHTIHNVLNEAEQKSAEVCTYIMISEKDPNMITFPKSHIEFGQVVTGEEILLNNVGKSSVCSSLYSLELIKSNNIKFTEGITSQDVDFNMHIYIYANRVILTKYICYYYYNNEQSATSVISLERKIKLLRDTICVNINYKNLSQWPQTSNALKKYFLKRSSSATVGVLLALIRDHNITKQDKESLLNMLVQNDLYPIKHRTLTWKSTALIPLLNNKAILNKLINIR